METVQQYPFVLCAWPSFADQPYITNYRIYDDRVGETTRFTYRPGHEWYWFPRQKPTERSEEHTSELQSLMRISYAAFCLKKKNRKNGTTHYANTQRKTR